MPDTHHYRVNYVEQGQRHSYTYWTTPGNDWAQARTWLAVHHPQAALLSVEYLGPHTTPASRGQQLQAALRRQGYSAQAAYAEVHGE